MNENVDTPDISFRPPWYLLAFWFLGGGGMLVFGLLVVGPLLQAPGWVRCFFVGMPSLALLVGLDLAFACVRVDRDGIVSRHFTRWSAGWEDVAAWSQLGPHSGVYLRTRDGRVRGFSAWCVYGARCDKLARLLEQRIGPSLTGEAAIAPSLLRQN